jgi:hypothetical protein
MEVDAAPFREAESNSLERVSSSRAAAGSARGLSGSLGIKERVTPLLPLLLPPPVATWLIKAAMRLADEEEAEVGRCDTCCRPEGGLSVVVEPMPMPKAALNLSICAIWARRAPNQLCPGRSCGGCEDPSEDPAMEEEEEEEQVAALHIAENMYSSALPGKQRS